MEGQPHPGPASGARRVTSQRQEDPQRGQWALPTPLTVIGRHHRCRGQGPTPLPPSPGSPRGQRSLAAQPEPAQARALPTAAFLTPRCPAHAHGGRGGAGTSPPVKHGSRRPYVQGTKGVPGGKADPKHRKPWNFLTPRRTQTLRLTPDLLQVCSDVCPGPLTLLRGAASKAGRVFVYRKINKHP